MKIVIVGANGTIGKAVTKALSTGHEIITVGRNSGNYQVNMTDIASIKAFYGNVGEFDALVVTAGSGPFKPVAELTGDDFNTGFADKLMGQVNLVLEGLKSINEQGSFTLTSGLLSHDPIKGAAVVSTINSALEGFVRGAAIDMPKQARINIVSPPLVTESVSAYGDFFKGYVPTPAAEVAQAYVKSVEGLQTGQVYKVGW